MGALNEFVFMVLLLIRTKICSFFLGLRQTNGFSSLGPKCLNASYLHGRQTKEGSPAKLFDCFCHALDSRKASLAEAQAQVPAGTNRLITRSAILLMTERMLCGATSL